MNQQHRGLEGLQARDFACRVLDNVFIRKQPFDETFNTLASRQPYSKLEDRDRGFARLIAATTLRRWGEVNAIANAYLERPLPAAGSEVRTILAMAVAQLVFLDVAPHAVIDLAVSQTKAKGRLGRFSGLVNAVLRKVAGSSGDLRNGEDVRLNTPPWLFARWERAFGVNAALAFAKAHAEEPPLDLSVKRDPQEWAARLGGIALPWGTVRLANQGRIENIEGYTEGEWWVQDAAAAIPALLLGDVAGKRVADLCAAPGGKTAQLAARGAIVTAVDLSPGRIRRLKQNLSRLNLHSEIVVADAGAWTPLDLYDAVLLDAPCSATGTIRRNPDIPYLKTEEDIATLAKVQARLLRHALTLVKPGGEIVYCTCSLEPEEGEAQLDMILEVNSDFNLEVIDGEELHFPTQIISDRGTVRTRPDSLEIGPSLNGMDGFFAAKLRRMD